MYRPAPDAITLSKGLLRTSIQGSTGKSVMNMIREARYALRMIGKAPSLACVAMITLALGIGANSAVFGVVNAVLLRPLPYEHPERVMMIRSAPLSLSPEFSASTLFDWRDRVP